MPDPALTVEAGGPPAPRPRNRSQRRPALSPRSMVARARGPGAAVKCGGIAVAGIACQAPWPCARSPASLPPHGGHAPLGLQACWVARQWSTSATAQVGAAVGPLQESEARQSRQASGVRIGRA